MTDGPQIPGSDDPKRPEPADTGGTGAGAESEAAPPTPHLPATAAPPPPPGPPAPPSHSRLEPGDPRMTGEMSFLDHLAELRNVLVHSVIGALVGALIGWVLAPHVLNDLIRRTVGSAIVISPMEAFNERLKLALLIGLVIALPYVFYRVWSFIVPGLLKRERSMILPMALGSMFMFALGMWACYAYVVPLVVDVMSHFMTPNMTAQIRVSDLLGFFYNMAIACGLVFQLPLVLMTLTAMGLVTPGMLMRQWRYAIVGVFFLTAIITPGDVVTAQLVMGVPMTGLYLISVGLSWLVARRKRADRKREEEEDA